MFTQTQGGIRLYLKGSPVGASRMNPGKVKLVKEEKTLGEKIILSETADLLIKNFVYLGPLYVGWLVSQAIFSF